MLLPVVSCLIGGELMNAEVILDIVLSSLLGTMHLSSFVTCIVWRIRKFRRGLHTSTAGFLAFALSIFFGVFLPIGGFTFLNGGTAGTKSLIIAMVFCPILLPFALREVCFCIFLDGNDVVKRTLFSETRINLREPGAYIDCDKPFTITFWISINCRDNQTIQFNSRRIEGDLASFLKDCKKVKTKAEVTK